MIPIKYEHIESIYLDIYLKNESTCFKFSDKTWISSKECQMAKKRGGGGDTEAANGNKRLQKIK